MATEQQPARGQWYETLAEVTAAIGGLGLVAMVALVVVSIIGRAFIWAGLSPVPGDTELVEAITAFVVASFMPLCQLRRGHAAIAILTDAFGARANRLIDLITDILLFGLALFLTWRHILGMLDKQRYGEVTFLLQFPVWWGYLGCLFGLVVWVIVGACCAARSGREFMRDAESQMAGTIH